MCHLDRKTLFQCIFRGFVISAFRYNNFDLFYTVFVRSTCNQLKFMSSRGFCLVGQGQTGSDGRIRTCDVYGLTDWNLVEYLFEFLFFTRRLLDL